ncbi:MAG: hypothetical protein HeimC3_12950 [Candidatus Heimdallarchaeota archaeon LC_3]|nr:MAG: hypothetical protein HeimC3_16000 [Candidatus Heimdallarchaeota archaeon LC_3]OLS26021.1 MAG: hypothetical protein HeimC3_12950 [Candidatus Heimdallarchaeota archaeon LC_3]
MFKQTTLKKFVIPILLILTVQSNVLPSQADQEDFSRFILRISLKQTFPEAQSMKKGNKSADWFIKKSKKGNPRKLEKLVNKTLLEKTTDITNELYPGGVKLAIDITKIPVYSKSKSKFITNGEAEKGTTKFYQFLGFSIAERQLKSPIAFHLMEKDDFKKVHTILSESLTQIQNKIKINMIILDRGFISSKIVQTLYSFNYSFIIAFRKSKKITKVFKLLEHPRTMKKNQFFIPSLENKIYRINTNCWVIKDYLYGDPSVKVNLVIWKLKKRKSKLKGNSDLKNEYFLYITSPEVSSSNVYDCYGKRWRIETAFRQIKSLQAKTRVIDPSHRIWLFAVACLLYSSWIYRHLPKDPDLIIPEDLVTRELQLLYTKWTYSRIPVRELVDQYLILLDKKRLLFF